MDMSSKDRPPVTVPADIPGSEADVNQYLAAYIMGVANRLNSGASAYYRKRFNLGMTEWRTLMAIGTGNDRIVREIAREADMDYTAASKSMRALQERGFVAIEQTSGRGRPAIATLTESGLALHRQVRTAARMRQRRLMAAFSPAEVDTLWALLRRVEAQIPHMNSTR
jgi:DNA-binding MarR family transcriptional regulator